MRHNHDPLPRAWTYGTVRGIFASGWALGVAMGAATISIVWAWTCL